MHAASIIERILEHGAKSSTYKLAILRALVDHTIEHPAQEPRNGLHHVPIVDVARRVLLYYWRPALQRVPQSPTPGRIVRMIRGLADAPLPGVASHEATAPAVIARMFDAAQSLDDSLIDAVLEVRHTLFDQPLRYIHNVGTQSHAELFSLLTIPLPGTTAPAPWDYDGHRKARPPRSELRARDWPTMLARERSFIVVAARTYEELSTLRYWLRDAILQRWLRECQRFSKSETPVASPAIFELPEPARDSIIVKQIRSLYRDIGLRRCLYTDRDLPTRWHLDHVLPHARFPVNTFWNLVPAYPVANSQKSDSIPLFDPALRARYQDHLDRCLDQGGELIGSQVQDTWRRYYQGPPPDSRTARLQGLWSLMDRTWGRLQDAGVPTWQPDVELMSPGLGPRQDE